MPYGYSVRLITLNKEANPKLLGVKLGRACVKNNVPVSQVSSKLGVSRQTVYNWFMGRSHPQNSIVKSVEKLLASVSQ